MTHLFRPADPPNASSPPVGAGRHSLLAEIAAGALALLRRLFLSRAARVMSVRVLLLVGLVVQGALILLAAYMTDLAISLMELWAELARKHLELTLS